MDALALVQAEEAEPEGVGVYRYLIGAASCAIKPLVMLLWMVRVKAGCR